LESFYEDDEAVGDMTRRLVSSGHRIFQIYKLAESDKEHVSALLNYLDPPANDRVLDAGCGVGEVSALMQAVRPDLTFVLLNISQSQLALCPAHLERIHGSIDDVPGIKNATFDAAMICYALGHGELQRTLDEMARVLRPGGVLMIYDMTAYNPNRLLSKLRYQLHRPRAVLSAADKSGFCVSFTEMPETTTKDFEGVMDEHEFALMFAGVKPIIYRFVKR
jgi:ubiquinone/menaquinone biosynthesis C-methylase UbiE